RARAGCAVEPEVAHAHATCLRDGTITVVIAGDGDTPFTFAPSPYAGSREISSARVDLVHTAERRCAARRVIASHQRTRRRACGRWVLGTELGAGDEDAHNAPRNPPAAHPSILPFGGATQNTEL